MIPAFGGRPIGRLLAVLLLLALPGVPVASREVEQGTEALAILSSGHIRERAIAAGEAHAYRVEVADEPLLVTVEQQGIDLVVEARGPEALLTADTGDARWGAEVLVLESAGAYRVEVRPGGRSVAPGRYTIGTETSPADHAALSLMSRAGQEARAGTPEAWRRAVTTFREARAAWRALGERRWEAEALSAIAWLEQDLRELRPAAEDALAALALWRQLGEPRREATTLNLLGVIRVFTGEVEAAREALEDGLALWQRLGERFDEAETRSNLCALDHRNGALPAALACYEEAHALFKELGAGGDEARMLNNLGGVYDLMGEPDVALDHYQRALALRRTLGDRQREAETLNNIAVIHRVLGEWQEALRVYGQVREILVPLGDRAQEATLLNNVGFTYNSLGEPQRALAFLEDALRLRREIGARRGEVITLNNLGSAWCKLGDLEKALDHHRQALELAVALGDSRQEAVSRLHLAEARLEQGDPVAPLAAFREIEPALAHLGETGLRHGEAQALQLWGRALAAAGRPREAVAVLLESLARRRVQRDPAGEAEALVELAAAERSLGRREAAYARAEEAVARVEELRAGFVSPDLRAAFLATRRRAHALVIDLLMDRHAADPTAGHDRTALAVSERVHARSLLDVLGSGTPGSAGRAGGAVPAGLRERRQSLRRRLTAKADQQLKQGEAKAAALEREIETLLAELDGVEAEIRRHDPGHAAFSRPRPIGTTEITEIAEITALLDPGTLLLEYALGEERSHLWAVGAEGLRSFVLPPRRQIEDLARRVHRELSTVEPGAGRREEAAETLSRILLGPVWSEATGLRRLVVVPDAALHVLPFGALPVPAPGLGWEAEARMPLLEHHEVVHLPSAMTLAVQRQRLDRRAPAPKWAAVLADPVFSPDDPRLAGPAAAGRQALRDAERGRQAGGLLAELERLPSSRREAEEIAELAPAGQVWVALDLAAHREAVLSGELRTYRVVHFATHAIADTRNPELSGLVLSLVDAAGRPREGFLGLSDISELDLAADLVVLSGCRTAMGKEVSGEGVMGLTRGFLAAGAPRVVASLWRVQDRATAELMTRFYRALWQERASPAAALREAQRSMRRDPRYRDPYSWAGFVLQGDWR